MAMYCGVGGVQKEIGSLYGGVGGVGKELDNIYGGVGGVSKEIYSAVQEQPLSALSTGSLLKLNETVGGVTTAVPFMVLAHGHHATGKTTLIRNQLWNTTIKYDAGSSNDYSGSDIDLWLKNTYKGYLDAGIQSQIVLVNITTGYYSLSRSVFLLSGTEVGFAKDGMYTEGTAIPYFSSNEFRIAYASGTSKGWWLRSPFNYASNYAFMVTAVGGVGNYKISSLYGVRPALTLPDSTLVSRSTDVDGCYTLI